MREAEASRMAFPRKRQAGSPASSMLRALPAFASCTDKELAELDRYCDEVTVAAGAAITRQGTPGREAFIILEGEAEVLVDGTVVAVLGPGDLVGEMSMLDTGPRSATVTARTPLRVLVVGPQAFTSFAELSPARRELTRVLVDRLRVADRQLGSTEH